MVTLLRGFSMEVKQVTSNDFCILSAYSVSKDGKILGYVWKKRGFSYRGTQGWNRGIRLQDYHPIEWYFGKVLGGLDSGSFSTQKKAIEFLGKAMGV